jgi:hypothetical protein
MCHALIAGVSDLLRSAEETGTASLPPEVKCSPAKGGVNGSRSPGVASIHPQLIAVELSVGKIGLGPNVRRGTGSRHRQVTLAL